MLTFLNEHMKYTIIFTNVTAVNVDKLKQVPLTNINFCISYYGTTPEKFKELTAMDVNLFNIVQKRLVELNEAGIKYNLERRDVDYKFDYPGTVKTETMDPKVKCHFHTMPKITANGDVYFCKFIRDNTPNGDNAAYANLYNVSLKDALEDPLRYKFFDSQSICINHCSSFSRSCYKESISGFKIMANSKKNYTTNKEIVDKRYIEIENAVVQRTQQ